jgi:staphylococcal nuclease domain-containing protein 1
MVLQREVQIEAYDTDKGGNLIASISIDGTSIAEALCEEGLATVHFSADRYGNIQTALYEAEARAKAARKNIHKDYDPVAEAAAEAARQAAYAGGGGGGDGGGRASKGPRVKAFKPVTVVHVEDATTFYGTYVDEAAAAKLAEVMKVLAEAKHEGGHTPKKNELCAAKFAADESWYRARVLSVPNAENPNYTIKFVDYGNTEEVSAASLAVMPEAVPQLKEQAVCMKFALLVSPPADYMAEATELLSNGIMNKDFSCSVEFAPPSGDYEAVQLVDEETTDDIALTMLSFGYATVNPRKERGGLAELQKKYLHEEDKAKAARAGMWIYGDVTEDPTDI